LATTAPIAWTVAFGAFGLYSPQYLAAPEEFRRTIGATSVGVVLVMSASFWSHSSFSREWVALTWGLALIFELSTRRTWRRYQGRLRVDGRLALRTLIVGTNREAGDLAEVLASSGSGFLALGFIRVVGPAVSPNSLPVVGGMDRMGDLIREHDAECLFVEGAGVGTEEMARVAKVARREGVEVRVSANLPHMLASRLSVHPIGTTIALALRPARLTRTQSILKRAFDLALASLMLLLSLPLWGMIAAVIRLSSGGPVLFRHQRVSTGMRTFTMYKFRTMVADPDVVLDVRSARLTAPFFKLRGDPRLTRFGRVIRSLSLDEIPQLWNVVRGEMSLVGPRPLPVEQVQASPELLGPRHEVPAGITGWWQINGRSELTPAEAVRLDLFYIENWSLALDLYILLKSFGAVLTRRGAY
jgi:exopolysaccharide biosynthesis polyprenyl glycosylphosphotransferase